MQDGFLLDKGADITVVNKKFNKGEQLTGDWVTLEGIEGTELIYPTAVVEIVAGTITIPIVVAVVDIGDSVDGGLLGNDIEQETFLALLKLASLKKLHAAHTVHVKMTRAESLRQQHESETVAKQEALDQASLKAIDRFVNNDDVEVMEEESVVDTLVDESVGLPESIADSSVDIVMSENMEEECEEVDTGRAALTLEEACNIDSDLIDVVQLQLRFRGSRQSSAQHTLRQSLRLMRPSSPGERWPQPMTKDSHVIRKETEGPGGEIRSLITVPARMSKQIITIAHDQFGHMSDKRTRYVVSRKFVWPDVAKDISTWCRSCLVCQRQGKVSPQRAPMCQTPILMEPFASVAIDLVGPFPKAKSGHRYLLTMIDLASRYPEALPLKTIMAEDVAEDLVELICRHGVPRTIL